MIARRDIDVVVIAMPDHWHTPMALRGLEAGKRVFSQKPTLTIAEGRLLVDTVKRTGGFFATALEDRSGIHYHKIAEAVHNGPIGKLKHIEVGMPVSRVFPKQASATVPEGLNSVPLTIKLNYLYANGVTIEVNSDVPSTGETGVTVRATFWVSGLPDNHTCEADWGRRRLAEPTKKPARLRGRIELACFGGYPRALPIAVGEGVRTD